MAVPRGDDYGRPTQLARQAQPDHRQRPLQSFAEARKPHPG
jgi:hypothetical protein